MVTLLVPYAPEKLCRGPAILSQAPECTAPDHSGTKPEQKEYRLQTQDKLIQHTDHTVVLLKELTCRILHAQSASMSEDTSRATLWNRTIITITTSTIIIIIA